MFNLGPGEVLVVFLVALIVLGPQKLPDAARQVGKVVAELRRLSSGFQDEMREAMQEPTPTLPPLAPPDSIDVAQSEPPSASKPAAGTTTRRRREPLRAVGPMPAEQQLSD